MTNLNSTLISKLFSAEDLIFNPVTADRIASEFSFDMTDCKGDALLIVDASGASNSVTLTLCGGDYPEAKADTVCQIPAGGCKYLCISGGEVLLEDGTVCFSLNSAVKLNTLNLKIAVVKKCMVVNH